jgi:hypothetical protein
MYRDLGNAIEGLLKLGTASVVSLVFALLGILVSVFVDMEVFHIAYFVAIGFAVGLVIARYLWRD